MPKTPAGEVRASMKIKSNSTGLIRETFRTFNTCEEAWLHMTKTMREVSHKRAVADRETVVCGYYYGKTVTGQKYGGMHIVKGQLVRPKDNAFYRELSITQSYYAELDNDMASL